MGYRVVILNRGYRSHWDQEMGVVSDGKKIFMTAYEAGDEAYLMAKTLPGVPVIIGKNRALTGQFAVDKMNAEVIIMDDGYQHWHLYRDLDVVLVDTFNMFGNGCLLPRGTLREPLSHLDRAGLFLLTKTDQSSQFSRQELRDTLISTTEMLLLLRVSIIPKILWKLLTGIKAYMKMRKIFLSCRVKSYGLFCDRQSFIV